jgi:hypothetical protein
MVSEALTIVTVNYYNWVLNLAELLKVLLELSCRDLFEKRLELTFSGGGWQSADEDLSASQVLGVALEDGPYLEFLTQGS